MTKVAAATSAATRTASQAASTPVRERATSATAVTKDAAKATAQTPTAKTATTTTRADRVLDREDQPTESLKGKDRNSGVVKGDDHSEAQPKAAPGVEGSRRQAERRPRCGGSAGRGPPGSDRAAAADLTLPLLVLIDAVAIFMAVRSMRPAGRRPSRVARARA